MALCLGLEAAHAETSGLDFDAYMSDAASPGLLGGVGLLATPTARMLPDGEIMGGASYQDPFVGAFLTWQALPWLELTGRYSDAVGTRDDLDPALDLKLRLYEGKFFPTVAVGFRDALGDGPYSGEYLVMSKSSGNFDISFGFGWGALGSRDSIGNPLRSLTGRHRDQGRGGLPQVRDYFSGDFGFFGGIAYATALRGLSVKLEYDGSDPRRLVLEEPAQGSLPFNIGADYRPLSWLHLSLGLLRGNSISASVALRFNPEHLVQARKRFDPAPLAVPVSEQPELPGQNMVDRLPVLLAVGASQTGPQTGPQSAPLSNGLPPDSLARITRGLYLAGLEEPMLEVEAPGEALVTLSLQPGLEERQTMLAAHVAFSSLPSNFDVVIIRNRLGDEVGAEGQRFSRDLVAAFARADASFNDLLQAGGVQGVILHGRDVEARVNGDETVLDVAALALSGLLSDAGRITVETADTLTQADAGDLTEARHHTQISNYLEKSGLRLRHLEFVGPEAVVEAELMRDMSPERLQMAADTVSAILGTAGGKLRLTAFRSNRPLVTATVPRSPLASVAEIRQSGKDSADMLSVGGDRPMLASFTSLVVGPRLAPLSEGEAEDIFARTRKQGLRPLAARLDGRKMTLAFANDRFSHPAAAVGRAARALSAGKPLDVDWFELITLEDGVESGRVTLLRRDFERAANNQGSPEEVWVHAGISRNRANFPADAGWQTADRPLSGFRWAIYPEVVQHFGSGDDGYRGSLFANASAAIDLFRHVKLSATLSREISGSLDDVPGRAPSSAPIVRSDIGRYATEGRSALRDARIDYTTQPLRDLYLKLSAGYFERMYGGAGVEMLYTPQGSEFAVGLDVNHVKKRDFDQRLGFADYKVTTGQVTLFHVWPRHGIETRLSAGRYLAGDWGVGVDVSRRFENGVRVGLWANMTDMSNKDFGGDAPAKGLYLSVPFDVLLPWSWKRDFGLAVRALNRDGGQTLDKGPGLFDLTRENDATRLGRDWRHLLN